MNDSSSRHTFILLATAFVLLLGASALPWGDLTGNRLKDFNLLGDLFPSDKSTAAVAASPIVDPELEELIASAQAAAEGAAGSGAGSVAVADSASDDTVAWIPPFEEAPVVNGHVVVECYTGGEPLGKLKAALAQAANRTVRIGVVGDSFIEGDIFTQDLRNLLQERYGGCGVGYVPMHSSMAGFRRSVRAGGEGWETFNILNMPRNDSVRFISGEYAVAAPTATATYKGSSDYAGTASWERSRFVAIARDTCSVTLTAADGASVSTRLLPSPRPQEVLLEANTNKLTVSTEGEGLIGLGVYLDGSAGVAVDCMSSRGSSGLNLRGLNAANCSAAVDYDLIIVEYGINALSADQADYAYYRIGMTSALEKLKRVYPHAEIIVFGIADRGAKVDGTVRSLPTCNAMTHAQRLAAQRAGVNFYDLRAAQGGEGAIVEWRNRQLVNADYIHLNHRGGRVLAEEFLEGLMLSLQSENSTAAL